jgi:hypothetical protein
MSVFLQSGRSWLTKVRIHQDAKLGTSYEKRCDEAPYFWQLSDAIDELGNVSHRHKSNHLSVYEDRKRERGSCEGPIHLC